MAINTLRIHVAVQSDILYLKKLYGVLMRIRSATGISLARSHLVQPQEHLHPQINNVEFMRSHWSGTGKDH